MKVHVNTAALLLLLPGACAPQTPEDDVMRVPSFVDVARRVGIEHGHHLSDELQTDYLRGVSYPTSDLIRIISGATSCDIDGDGFLDVVTLGGEQGARVFLGTGDGNFADATDSMELELDPLSSGPMCWDYDGDGYMDLLVAGIGEDKVRLLRNREGAAFTDATSESGLVSGAPTVGANYADFDGDGDFDLILARWGQFYTPGDEGTITTRAGITWRNDAGTFVDVTAAFSPPLRRTRMTANGELSETTFAPNFADIDADGDPDLLLVQDFGTSAILRNDSGDELEFSDITDRTVINEENGMGAAVADYDNDGDLDWFVTSIYADESPLYVTRTGNRLYENLGNGEFADVTEAAGIRRGSWGWGACFADFNNDGLLDIFHVNGWGAIGPQDPSAYVEFEEDQARLFLQTTDPPKTFVPAASQAGIADDGQGRGVVCFDFDDDGDQDVLIANQAGPHRLYQNALDPTDGGGGNYVSVWLRGPTTNLVGIGARVTIETETGEQFRTITSSNNFVSQDPPVAHFGLGAIRTVAKVSVDWPHTNKQSVLTNVRANQRITIDAP